MMDDNFVNSLRGLCNIKSPGFWMPKYFNRTECEDCISIWFEYLGLRKSEDDMLKESVSVILSRDRLVELQSEFLNNFRRLIIRERERARMRTCKKGRVQKYKSNKRAFKLLKPDLIDSRIVRGGSCCNILKQHHDLLRDDPDRLSTDFIKNLSGCACKSKMR